jgi:hypothetical protein
MFEPISDEQLDELRGKHGSVYVHATPQGPVYFRCPTRAEIEAALEKQRQGLVLVAADQLALRCAVYPPGESLKPVFTRFPLLSDGLSTAVLEVAKGDEAALAKKQWPGGGPDSET